MKKKRFVLVTLVVLVLVVAVIVIFNNTGSKPITYTYNPQETTTTANSNDYNSYLEKMKKEHSNAGTPKGVSVSVAGVDYSKSLSELTEEGTLVVYDKDDESLNIKDTDDVNDKLLYTPDKGSVTWEINVPEAGFYNLKLTYYPIKGTSSAIERRLSINGEEMFDKTTTFVFSRVWGNGLDIIELDTSDTNNYLTTIKPEVDTKGNDVKPKQQENPELRTAYFKDDMGYTTEPYMFYFEKGMNTIELDAVKENILIDKLTVESIQEGMSYEEYKASNEGKNVEAGTYSSRVEAEAAISKSSPTLYPQTDRTSSMTYPYEYSATRLNSIGGDSWRVLGDWITWEVEVPADGYYNISLRAKQSTVRGMYSNRIVYIDGEVAFDELKQTIFSYSSDWQLLTLGNEQEKFEFYLTKGTHTITMEVTLGDYAALVEEIEDIVAYLNDLYLEIIKFTTTSPDAGRDYELANRTELNLMKRLETAKTRLETVSKSISDISGTQSDKTGVIDTFVVQLEDFLEDEARSLPSRLGTFSNNISSLGTILADLREAPLMVDYIMVHTPDYELPKANEGFFKGLWDGIVNFFYSFFIDYSTIGAMDTDAEVTETIEVWMTLGRDQANVIRRLADENFTPKTGVQIDLKITGTDVLLKSTLAGIGPDVAINVDSSLPVNYGLRNAVYDISQFEDYEEVAKQFSNSGNALFTFDWGGAEGRNVEVYALPEKELFLMMFVRDDIMEKYGWADKVPNTWDEVIDLVANLQAEQLQFYLPVNDSGATALNPIFVSLLYQMGGELYINDNKETGLLNNVGMEAFETWTEFYTLYSFPSYASFINRFRSGEMPIGIAYYETYNTLSVFAPELRGTWSYYPIPGSYRVDDNGEVYIDHTSVVSGTGAVILRGPAEADESIRDASWEFLKWWTSTETQTLFGQEMEGILGSAARQATANIDALKGLAWPKDDLNQLLKQWGFSEETDSSVVVNGNEVAAFTAANSDGKVYKNVYGVHHMPNIAGSYITGREVENAFREVINNLVNAKETLYEYANNINNEIDRKRGEFGLPLASDEEE
ncbi:MAG: extracellular solute-binding protein [Bacilli bacterium]|nr:extracellular solute-binding protein [Bacilli bacterium]